MEEGGPRPGSNKNLEVFVTESIQKIYDAAGKTKELKQLRDQCKELIDQLLGEEFGKQGSKTAIPFTSNVSQQLLTVFKASFATGNIRIVEPALSCLHKLVAYAYLQGEASNSGRLDDLNNMVTQAVTMTAKCGESNSLPIQLAVVKALLTFVTAEHFLVHGDCLMQAVRTVFNLAIGSTSTDMQSTAQSALLQMLNTVLKRVGQQVGSPHYTPQPSPLQQLYHWQSTASEVEATAAMHSAGAEVSQQHSTSTLSAVPSDAALAASDTAHVVSSPAAATSTLPPDSPREEGEAAALLGSGAAQTGGESPAEPRQVPSRELSMALAAELVSPVQAGNVVSGTATPAASTAQAPPSPPHSSSSAQPAHLEHGDDESMALLPPGLPRIDTKSREGDGEERASREQAQGVAPQVDDDARAAQLASLAEQADLRGLERAFDTLPQQTGAVPRRPSGLQRQETPPDPRRAIMHDRRVAAWSQLTVVERDAVIVLSAMCKMAARETGFGAVETYMHKGKLLALNLLLRVLSNPMHDWGHVRPVFASALRQPLCVALLRNCMSPYDQALTAAVKIFGTVLAVPRLRSGMKAELGALYPLLLLRPIETERPDSAHQVQMAVEGILGVCSSAQVLVDVFVNYDCSLQASNLFERTIKALTKVVQLPDTTPLFPAAATPKMKQTALKAMLAAVKSLDTWAGPIKSAAAAAGEGGAEAEEGIEPALSSSLPNSPQRQLLERIAAAKEMKDSLEAAITLFNKKPMKGVKLVIDSGLADGSPESVAQFLREHASRLDKEMVGELFGDHEDFSIQVMHAYIDMERYMGLTIDAALRKLLASFRLPGEAQKIDRIMEKFAERFCRDNPAMFATADGAYLLAFAIIMLNTDAHNPMADRRIMAEDFVNMSMYQTEEGEFEPIMPAEDLQAIYKRITDNEIKLGEDELSVGAAVEGSKAESSRRAKLASAVGLPQMVLPFWAGATWDKQHGVDVERKRFLAITQEMRANGGMVGNMWHTASHAEHARPMLQVSGNSVLKGLTTALAAAPSLQAAAPILDAYEQAIQLAALLRLEALCESLLSSLAAAASLEAPAPFYSNLEAKQVAALSKVVSLASCSEAGLLGTSWVVVLRTLSHLERLQAALMPGAHPTMPFGNGMMGSSSDLTTLPPPPQPTSSFGRLLQRMGLGSSSEAGDGGTKTVSGLPIREGPGAGFVLWAETAGSTPIERVYSNSANLSGDAVVTFMRALCAVSQEELSPSKPGERPRVHLLQKVVECAYHNMGRIRLVWSRLWSVVAQHLVSAACHTDPYVAMYAVDALRQLVAKLLDKAELARFTYQGDALRPFAAILRHSDSPGVRELAVACVVHAIAAHARGLGSGWRSVIEALTVAAGDSSSGVVNQALDALQPVIEAMYHPDGIGHAGLRECLAAVLTAVHNPHGFEDLSIGALYLFQTVARRLSDAVTEGANEEELLQLPSPTGLRSGSEQAGGFPSPTRAPLPGSSDLPLALALAAEASRQSLGEPLAAALASREASTTGHGGVSPFLASWCSGAPEALPGLGQQPRDTVEWAWQLVLVPLATAARLDARPKVADTAAAVLFQVLRSHGHAFSAALWQGVYGAAVVHVFALPAAPGSCPAVAAEGARSAGVSQPVSPASALQVPAAEGPASSRTTAGMSVSRTSSLPSPTALLAAAGGSVGRGLSSEGLYRLERHASAHLPDLWSLITEHYSVAGPTLLLQVLSLLQQYVSCPSEALSVLGVNQLYHLVHKAGVVLDTTGWQAVVGCLEAVCLVDPMQGVPAPPPVTFAIGPSSSAGWDQEEEQAVGAVEGAAALAHAIRRRCRLQVLLQRVLDLLLQHSAACMPGGTQLALLGVLRGMVRRAEAFNGGYGGADANERARLQAGAVLAAAGPDHGAAQDGTVGFSAGEASWEVVERPGQGGGHAAERAAATVRLDLLMVGGAGGELSAHSGGLAGEGLVPALVRQEVQGGCLLIAALQRCSDQTLTCDQSEPLVQQEAEGQLAAYCLEVVEAAAARVRGVKGQSAAGSGPVAFRAGQVLQPWEDSLRAPLEEAALHAIAGLGREAWQRQQPGLFHNLSELMCTPSMAVRRALAQLMRRQLPATFPGLELVPQAAA